MFKEKTVNQSIFDNLQQRVSGSVLTAQHENYDEARQLWNGMIDRFPAVIVEVASAEDVATCIQFARKREMVISIRGGGHNVAGFASNDGGMVIDLKQLNAVNVDPVSKTVMAGGGATIGQLDAATQAYGLAVPMGLVSRTGIAGLTLGGGAGWMRNKYGMACDNLIGAEVVTADGMIVQASEQCNRELLWGLRGGGGNFGVVTRFDYRAYPLGPDVYLSAIFHAGNDVGKALRFMREQMPLMPDELSVLCSFGRFPAVDAYPSELHGKPFAAFMSVYIGDADKGADAAQPLYALGEPLLDMSSVLPYLELQQLYDDDYPDGMRYYWKSQNMHALSDAAIDVIVTNIANMPLTGDSTLDIWYMAGEIARLPASHGAFSARNARYLFNVEANWHAPEHDAAHVNWTRTFLDQMQPFAEGGRYINFPGFNEEGDDLMKTSFPNQYDRLLALKQKWDPHNVFRMNANIKPD